jgi:hypothetical protein
MTEETLEQVIARKARIAGLEYDIIEVSDRRELNPGIVTVGEKTNINVNNGTLKFETDDINMPADAFEALIDYLISQEKTVQEGLTERKVFCASRDLAAIGIEMSNAHYAYWTAKEHIKTFGQESFDTYQIHGLEEFVNISDSRMKLGNNVFFGSMEEGFHGFDEMSIIASLYKEEIKCRFMKTDPQLIPRGVANIVEPFGEAFEMINNTELEGVERSKLIHFMAVYVYALIDARKSYESGKLIKTATQLTELLPLYKKILEKLGSKQDTYDAAIAIGQFMETRYTEIANR